MLSRVADSLYWMSRYLERAEHIARVVDVHLNLLLELPATGRRTHPLLDSLPAKVSAAQDAGYYEKARALTFDSANESSLAYCIERARENARQVREQISSEMWEQLNQLFLFVRRPSSFESWDAEPHTFFQAVKEGSHLFQGIADSTMNHSEGWDFIQVGRFMERGCSVAALLDAHYAEFHTTGSDVIDPDDYFDWVSLLKSCTAFEPYCKVYTANLRPYAVAEFLMLNAEFPHSVRFSIEMVQNGLSGIAEATRAHKSGRAQRLAGRLVSGLNYSQIDEIIAQGVNRYLKDIQQQCAGIHSAFYQTYISYPIDTARLRLESSEQ
jgi:uncharacterized alpha-E superfamily protein